MAGLRAGCVQHGVILIGSAAEEELMAAAPGRRADRARPHELGDPRGQGVAAREGRGIPGVKRILRREPGAGLGGACVLEPAVRIAQHLTEYLLGEIEPPGVGIGQFGHARHPNGAGPAQPHDPRLSLCGSICYRAGSGRLRPRNAAYKVANPCLSRHTGCWALP